MSENQHKRIAVAALVVTGIASTFAGARSASAGVSYITSFPKTDNIYTNLNQEYPHTGTGTPGSAVGTANASFLFDPTPAAVTAAGYAPDYIAGSNTVNNGVKFNLTSDASGHDFEELAGTNSVVVPVGLSSASNVYLLAAAYNTQRINVTFTGADGTTQSFTNLALPDFNGGSVNTTGTNFFDQPVFAVHDVGAGGNGNSATGATNNYDLNELGFTLLPSLTSQPLTSVTIQGVDGSTALVLGISVTTVPEPTSLALLGLGAGALLARRRVKA